MLIDSHAHLFKEDFGDEVDEVIKRARDAGIVSIVVPGTNLQTSNEAVALAEQYDFIVACVGYHPHEVSKATDEDLSSIESLCQHPKVVAIGEIGMDYHYNFSPRDRQADMFKRQLEMAVRHNLPVVVHTRECIPEAIDVVEKVVGEHPEWGDEREGGFSRGVFHCFTGNEREAARLFSMGFYVSYPGIVTFKNSPVLSTIKAIGPGRIMLETDSPYLAPAPFRGKRNEPAYIVHTARKIADLLDISAEELGDITSQNARFLFGMKFTGSAQTSSSGNSD